MSLTLVEGEHQAAANDRPAKMTDDLLQSVKQARASALSRLLSYASHNPKTANLVLRINDTVDDLKAFDLRNELDQHLSGMKDKRYSDAVLACLEAFEEAENLSEEIADHLSGNAEYRAPTEQGISEFFATVETLPPAVPRPVGALPEGVKLFHGLRQAEPREWLVQGVIPRKGTTLKVGPSGVGKTLAAMDEGLCIATGKDWRGRATTAGGVLYFVGEGAAGLGHRVSAWSEAHGVKDAPFAVVERAFDLTSTKGADALIGVTISWGAFALRSVALIVIDTLARNFGGADENSGSAMGSFVANVDRIGRETGAHVMVVHHTGKDASRGARGHGSLVAAMDTVISVSPGLMTIEKQRDGAAGETFPFDIVPVTIGEDEHGNAISSAVLHHKSEAARKTVAIEPLALLVAAIRKAEAEGSPMKMNGSGSLQQRRVEMPAPLCGMGRPTLQGLAKRAISGGLLLNMGGILTAIAKG